MWYLWAALSKRKGPPAGAKGPTAQPRPVPRSASRRKRERRREQAIHSLSHPRGGGRRRWIINGAIGAVIVGAIVAVVLLARGSASGPTPTFPPAPSPTLNPAALAAPGSPSGSPIDGIQCQTAEQVVYHIHAHLAVYVNGTTRIVPEVGTNRPSMRSTSVVLPAPVGPTSPIQCPRGISSETSSIAGRGIEG